MTLQILEMIEIEWEYCLFNIRIGIPWLKQCEVKRI